MCTVTFVPFEKSKYVLTQNRDVSTKRPKAKPPQYQQYNQNELFYPVDVKGGGTWNAVSTSHHAFLLNGADYNYYPDFNAPRSRGSLCLDLLTHQEGFMDDRKFKGYDDFTLVLFPRDLSSAIEEWRWDGYRVKYKTRRIDQPYMWISRGMYTREDFKRKRQLFDQFLLERKTDSKDFVEEIWRFHHQKMINGQEGFLISRSYNLGTVSVLQIFQQDNVLHSRYEDRTHKF